MMPQFAALLDKGKAFVNWEYMAKGLFIFSIGLFKKNLCSGYFCALG